MRFHLAGILILGCGTAYAQPFVFDGPRDRDKVAQSAYVTLGQQCPRLIQSEPDYASIGLHRVAPGSQGVYGPVIRQFEARSVLVITIKLLPRTKTVPAPVVPKNRIASMAIIDAQQSAILVLDNPAALWLCDKSIFEGDRMALIPAPGLHDILGH